MNTHRKSILVLAALVSSSPAAIITPNAGSAPGTDGYAFNVSLDSSNNDSTTFAGTVGSWSWEDASLGLGNAIGWRHQSQWIAITLAGDSTLDIEVHRNDILADAKLFPSFTIYRNHTDITSSHFFENNQTLSWDSDLAYIGHVNNTTEGDANGTYDLPAGDYTLVLGGNATSEALPVNVNYSSSLEVSPSSIPEPSSVILSLVGGLGALTRRRR